MGAERRKGRNAVQLGLGVEIAGPGEGLEVVSTRSPQLALADLSREGELGLGVGDYAVAEAGVKFPTTAEALVNWSASSGFDLTSFRASSLLQGSLIPFQPTRRTAASF